MLVCIVNQYAGFRNYGVEKKKGIGASDFSGGYLGSELEMFFNQE